MQNFTRAEDVFKDFPDEIKSKIFEAARGKLVYFPKIRDETAINRIKVCQEYANGKTYREISEKENTNKVRIWRIIQEERKKLSRERIMYWQDKGLKLRQLGKLYNISSETVRQRLKKGGTIDE